MGLLGSNRRNTGVQTRHTGTHHAHATHSWAHGTHAHASTHGHSSHHVAHATAAASHSSAATHAASHHAAAVEAAAEAAAAKVTSTAHAESAWTSAHVVTEVVHVLVVIVPVEALNIASARLVTSPTSISAAPLVTATGAHVVRWAVGIALSGGCTVLYRSILCGPSRSVLRQGSEGVIGGRRIDDR